MQVSRTGDMLDMTRRDGRYNPIVFTVLMQCLLIGVNKEPMPGEKRGGVVGWLY